MVFKSLTLYARSRGPDEFWRKRRIFRLASHFKNRKQNCYSLAIRGVCRSLQYATVGRKLKKQDLRMLWETRIDGICKEFGISGPVLLDGLSKCNIFLNRKTLADLAVWEPRTFKALSKIALARNQCDGLNSIKHLDPPAGVITRGMLK